jgi:hypothetical protein
MKKPKLKKEVIFSNYDLSKLSEEEKGELIKEFSELICFQCLDLFNALKLDSHIEASCINQANDKMYILHFQTMERFAETRAKQTPQ